MRYLESERLLIKPIEEEDINELLEIRWDKDTMKYMIHEPISRQQQLTWFKSLTKKDLALSIFLKHEDKNKLIGTVGFYNIDMRHQRTTLRVRLSKDHWGKGIGYEAMVMVLKYGFNELNLRKICGDSFSDNEAIKGLTRKVGFKIEGHLSEHFYHNGKFRDVVFVGLFKDDFFKAIKKNGIPYK